MVKAWRPMVDAWPLRIEDWELFFQDANHPFSFQSKVGHLVAITALTLRSCITNKKIILMQLLRCPSKPICREERFQGWYGFWEVTRMIALQINSFLWKGKSLWDLRCQTKEPYDLGTDEMTVRQRFSLVGSRTVVPQEPYERTTVRTLESQEFPPLDRSSLKSYRGNSIDEWFLSYLKVNQQRFANGNWETDRCWEETIVLTVVSLHSRRRLSFRNSFNLSVCDRFIRFKGESHSLSFSLKTNLRWV